MTASSSYEAIDLTEETVEQWLDEAKGPVALHLKQKLLPVEGEGGVVFPPTYADIGYNIDTLADGTKVATIDSVGSQANRMEPMFKREPYSALVPQIEIAIDKKGKDSTEHRRKISILDLAHRVADATVYACPTLRLDVERALFALSENSDAGPLCRLAPTSLVFGIWDSRGATALKCPRLVRSVIRAWDVQPLHAAAQFNSIWKNMTPELQDALKNAGKGKNKKKLSEVGFADAPAVFRTVSQGAAKEMTEFRNGSPNPERRLLGGVLARGAIERDVTLNLVALRQLGGASKQESVEIRQYLLALALLAATEETDLFLREGCHLRLADEDDIWEAVPRRGKTTTFRLVPEAARSTLLLFATKAAEPFRAGWPTQLLHEFDLQAAAKLLEKKEKEKEDDDA